MAEVEACMLILQPVMTATAVLFCIVLVNNE